MTGVAILAKLLNVLNMPAKLNPVAAVCPATIDGVARDVPANTLAAVPVVAPTAVAVVPAAAGAYANREVPPLAYANAAMAAIFAISRVGAHMVRFVSSLQVKFLLLPHGRMQMA